MLVGCASIAFDYPQAESTAFSDTSDTQLGRLINTDKVGMSRAEVNETRYSGAVDHSIKKIIHEDLTAYTWAPYEFVLDSPNKTFAGPSDEFRSIVEPVQDSTRHATQELLVLSPYVVMHNDEIEEFRRINPQVPDN